MTIIERLQKYAERKKVKGNVAKTSIGQYILIVGETYASLGYRERDARHALTRLSMVKA